MRVKLALFIACVLFSNLLYADDSIQRIDKNFEITRLSNNVYLMKSAFSGDGNLNCNHLIIIDSAEIILVNTPVNDSLTAVMLTCIEKRFKKPVKKVIATHFHEDSSGGLNETAKRGIVSYGLDKTNELLKPAGKKIDVVFSDSLSIHTRNEDIKLLYFGGGHSKDNIVVWLPFEKILFGGCLLKALSVNNKGNIKDADLNSWANTVSKIKNRCRDAKIVIPGHMEIGDASILDHTIEIAKMP